MTVPTPSMRAGNIQYLSSIQTGPILLDPAQIAAMDPVCSAQCNRPWGPGVDPNVLAVLNLYPAPNGLSAGDGLNTASFTGRRRIRRCSTRILPVSISCRRIATGSSSGVICRTTKALPRHSSQGSLPARPIRITARELCGRYMGRLFQSHKQSALRVHPPGLRQPWHRPRLVRELLQHQSTLCRGQNHTR